MPKRIVVALVALSLLSVNALAQSTAPPDAERFVDPVSAYSATISPSGAYVAYIARDDKGRQIVIVDMATRTARAIQAIDENLGLFNWVRWMNEDRLIVSTSVHQESHGGVPTGHLLRAHDIKFDVDRIFALNRDGSGLVQMFQGQMHQLYYGLGSTDLVDVLRNDPSHVLISAWDNSGFGVWRGDLSTGHVERVVNGSENAAVYVTDGDGAVVMREDWIPDGSGYRIYRRAPGDSDWTFFLQARRAATATNSPDFQVLAAGPGAAQVYVLARPGNNDLLRLYLFNTATGELNSPLERTDNVDIEGAWFSPQTRQVLATCEFGRRYRCSALDAGMRRNLGALDHFFGSQATITLVDMSDDSAKWLLYVDGPTLLDGYYLYDVADHNVAPIASVYPHLQADALSPTEVVEYSARDGAQLWAYVTARPGVAGARPTVVLPHGGPEARDEYGYDAFVQFLASRGYVVVQPNFRGGSGFGRAFADAGRGQWGLRMQDDVTDAVTHLIQTGVADPHRICIVGASYGGYAALEGVAATPDLYRCAVSIAGVSDLIDMLVLEGQEGHGQTNYQYWLRSIGDPTVNRAALEAASPRRHADHITAPVLLIHGEDDDVVPIRHSRLMQQALDSAGRETRLIRIPEEGHYWNDWSREHRLTLYRETEAFLAQHLSH
jgi:dipeptidyl aminopeptidase/acylaminoacyl peptidase